MINKKSTLSVGQNPGVHCLTNNLTVGTKTQPVSVTVGADMLWVLLHPLQTRLVTGSVFVQQRLSLCFGTVCRKVSLVYGQQTNLDYLSVIIFRQLHSLKQTKLCSMEKSMNDVDRVMHLIFSVAFSFIIFSVIHWHFRSYVMIFIYIYSTVYCILLLK